MQDGAFFPQGPTVTVTTAIVQVPATTGDNPSGYRVRCLSGGYLAWAPAPAVNTANTTLAVTAPVAGTPSPFTIGMATGSVEKLILGPNMYFISSVANGFEVTPGEGVS